MNKNIKRALLFAALSLCGVLASRAQAAPPLGTDHSIVANWTAPANQTPCSSSITKSCLLGYTETITPPVGVSGNNVIPNCSASVTTSCIGAAATSYTWTPVPGPLYSGTWNVSLVANYLDASGNPVASTAISTTVIEPVPFVAGPAIGLNVSTAP